MSYVSFHDRRKPAHPTIEQSYKMWRIKEGLDEPEDDKQTNFLKQVKAIYLPWRSAPRDYVEANWTWIKDLAMRDWIVDKYGVPVKPDGATGVSKAWKFAKEYGLWEHGRVTRKTGLV